jgi:hypothetical protein
MALPARRGTVDGAALLFFGAFGVGADFALA